MPELNIEEAEAIAINAAQRGQLSPDQAEQLAAFYQRMEGRVLKLYDAARVGASRIYDRDQLVAYWQEQADWFGAQLTHAQEVQEKLSAFGIEEQPVLHTTIEVLTEIVDACLGHRELHA